MKFLQAGAIYVVANVTSAAIPFLLLPILTRVLEPNEYGQVVSFALLVTFCLTFSGLNAHAALGVIWFRRPREEIPSYIGAALSIALGSTVAIAFCTGVVLWFRPALGGGLNPIWGVAAALVAGANVILQCRLVLWQSEQKALHSASLQLVASTLNVGLSLVAVLWLGWGAAGRNAGISVSAALLAGAAVFMFQTQNEVRWSISWDRLKFLVTFGLPLIFHTFAGVLLSTADRWIISIQIGTGSLGVYGAGAQLGMTMGILGDAFVKAYGPWMYQKLASSKSDDKLHAVGAIYAMVPISFCAAAALSIVLRYASGIVLGPQFQESIPLLPWFMLGGAFTVLYTSTSVLFFFSGRTALLSSVTLPSAILGAILTWILVERYGVPGAAMGYAASQGILALFVGGVACWSFELPWRECRKAIAIWAKRSPRNPVLSRYRS
ncbi:lipopolysaccharide biosynthesis protein [Bradyrhizobium centrosematis]|uniref:lipopolysaccharide biosynthesis protein n=1 Tax=Bradyrhizobium centrosematis TaxID=1300039 RepID=UPI002169E4B7|nr:oligosaccharide flippase family protein [Bradyrhizobium centrosematis]MCS3765321.1 O-antigen/teichoic acid export membrane protein [Bradyrhizobium centrosematis]MCS3773979.1 O-antigen/teichoic acid export membrane protein [Bradyrhizobium centrosematis]